MGSLSSKSTSPFDWYGGSEASAGVAKDSQSTGMRNDSPDMDMMQSWTSHSLSPQLVDITLAVQIQIAGGTSSCTSRVYRTRSDLTEWLVPDKFRVFTWLPGPTMPAQCPNATPVTLEQIGFVRLYAPSSEEKYMRVEEHEHLRAANYNVDVLLHSNSRR